MKQLFVKPEILFQALSLKILFYIAGVTSNTVGGGYLAFRLPCKSSFSFSNSLHFCFLIWFVRCAVGSPQITESLFSFLLLRLVTVLM